jgi:hypothetical protein
MRFNYLSDGVPDAIERLQPSRIPDELKTPLAALATVTLAVLCWLAIEKMLIGQATAELRTQTARLQSSRVALGQARLQRTQVEALLALDTKLRVIRRSGAVLAGEMADIANHVPRRAWLTGISQVDDGLEIDGNALGLDTVGETVTDLMSSSTTQSPQLVRAATEDTTRNAKVLSFAVRVEAR